MEKKLDVVNVNQRNNLKNKEMTPEEKRCLIQRQKARQRRIKKQRRRHFFQMMMLGVACVIILAIAGKILFRTNSAEKTEGILGTADAMVSAVADIWAETFLYDVKYEEFFEQNKPQKFSERQVRIRLKELAQEYPKLQEISDEYEKYPIELLEALCNNPEMYEYVKDYPAYADGTYKPGKAQLTEIEKKQKYPLFLQWDKRWGYEEYGGFNIAISGCGPTTLAMAVVALTENDTVTPDVVADFSMKNDHYMQGTGTAWSLMREGCEAFGLKSEEFYADEEAMKEQLDEGKVLICSMQKGDFTSGGHFVMIYDYDEKGFFVNDPNCIYRSSRAWTYEELEKQIKIYWTFEKKL